MLGRAGSVVFDCRIVSVEFRQLYAEKLQRNEPWWETDFAHPRTRIRSAWATMPPRTSLEDIRALLSELSGLCELPTADTDAVLIAGADTDAESQKDDGEPAARGQADQSPAAAELDLDLAASLAAAEDDPAAHRLLRRHS